MLNHLRKGHNLIGHLFGRNLHKSNMAATVSHEKYICSPFVYRKIIQVQVKNFVEKQNGHHCEIWFLYSWLTF